MINTWDSTELSNIAEIFSGFAFKSDDLIIDSEQIPVIKIGQIQNKNVLKNVDDYFPKEKINERLSRYFLKKEDILIAMTGAGSVGKVGRMKNVDRRYLVNQRVALVRKKNNSINSVYLYYFLIQDFIENGLYDLGLGAGQPNISGTDIGKLKLHLPPLPIQKKIAAVLSAYDDLIETNERRIQVLETMAEELYKEWFVRLRFPGYEFTKIVKGVPEGWEVKKVGDVVEFLSGYSFKSETFSNSGNFGIVTIKNVQDGFFISECTDYINEFPANMKDFCKLNTGDILMSLTGNVGRICHVVGNNLLLNQRVAKIRARDKDTSCHMYYTLKNKSMLGLMENLSLGSTAQMNLSTVDLSNQKLIVPNLSLRTNFEELVSPQIKNKLSLINLNSLLKTARDRLLSRLVSGKIDLTDLDIQFPPSMEEESQRKQI